MADAILVVNAGSSSIKFSVFVERAGTPALALRGQIEGLYTRAHFVAKDAAGATAAEKTWDAGAKLGHEGAVDHLAAFLRSELSELRLAGVGHRVVHGGLEYTKPVRMDANVLAKLEKLNPLAPLHQPNNLKPIRLLLERQPQLPQVACFDTSFHRSQPPVAQRFALPDELHEAGVRRYGFHGLSYEYIASVLPQHDRKAAAGRTVVLHLGNGASMCAMEAGKSVASTMGFTAVDGLPMGTRCGSIDPGVILYLMDERGMDARAIEKLIYNESGLLGVSGISSDMRALLASKEPRAKFAVDLYIYRIRREPRIRLGDPDERGTDDRTPHARVAWRCDSGRGRLRLVARPESYVRNPVRSEPVEDRTEAKPFVVRQAHHERQVIGGMPH
jgi:acetate kinase